MIWAEQIERKQLLLSTVQSTGGRILRDPSGLSIDETVVQKESHFSIKIILRGGVGDAMFLVCVKLNM